MTKFLTVSTKPLVLACRRRVTSPIQLAKGQTNANQLIPLPEATFQVNTPPVSTARRLALYPATRIPAKKPSALSVGSRPCNLSCVPTQGTGKCARSMRWPLHASLVQPICLRDCDG